MKSQLSLLQVKPISGKMGPPRIAFIGYTRIEVEPLETDKLNLIGDRTSRQRIADQLSNFLFELHNIDLSHFSNSIAIEKYDPLKEWRDLFYRIQEKLYPFMTENAYRWTERHFTDFFTTKTSASISPSFIHGYFGTSNIQHDISSHQITGIIDFGSAKIGEPAVDYAALLASYGDDFIQMVKKHNRNIRSMMVLCYKGTFAIQEALFGLEHDDLIAFQSGIATVNMVF